MAIRRSENISRQRLIQQEIDDWRVKKSDKIENGYKIVRTTNKKERFMFDLFGKKKIAKLNRKIAKLESNIKDRIESIEVLAEDVEKLTNGLRLECAKAKERKSQCMNTIDTMHSWQDNAMQLQAEKDAIARLIRGGLVNGWSDDKIIALNAFKNFLSNSDMAAFINFISGADHSSDSIRRKLSRLRKEYETVEPIEPKSPEEEHGDMPEVFNADNLKAGMLVKIKTWDDISKNKELTCDGTFIECSTFFGYSKSHEPFIDSCNRVVEIKKVMDGRFYILGYEYYLPFYCIESMVSE